MLCLMQTSESEEGPSAHNTLTHLLENEHKSGYIKKTSITIKQWNSTAEYSNVKNKLSKK